MSMTKIINAALFVYGIISITMGVQAYFFPHDGKHPSPMSIIAGCALGLLMIGSYFLWTSNPRAGRILSAVLALLAMFKFASQFFSGTWYPGGTMFVLSFGLVCLLGAGHMFSKKPSSADTK
jgi:hypothetical protein